VVPRQPDRRAATAEQAGEDSQCHALLMLLADEIRLQGLQFLFIVSPNIGDGISGTLCIQGKKFQGMLPLERPC
jgi:hypothetical protein